MDSSQEAANRAQVKSYHLGRWTVVLAIIQIVLTIYSIWPTQNQGGTFMLKGWLPTLLLLANPAITAVVLLFFAIKLRQTKGLAKEIISLKANLSEASTKLAQQEDAAAKVDALLDEKQSLGEELSRRSSEITHCKRQLGEAQETIRQLENSKRELTDESTKLGRDLKEANLRANQEKNQRDIWMKTANDAERKLVELSWLESRMKQQAEKLDTWVRIKKANRVKLKLSKTPRMVVVAFWVKNNSVFTVTFNFKFLTGCLQFKGHSLRDPVRLPPRSNPIEDLEPGALIEIILEQPLLQSEAETILDARQNGDVNAIFSLADLDIPIFVRNIPQEVAAGKLKIHPEIQFMEASEFPCDKKD